MSNIEESNELNRKQSEDRERITVEAIAVAEEKVKILEEKIW
jgi:hypothetical protein